MTKVNKVRLDALKEAANYLEYHEDWLVKLQQVRDIEAPQMVFGLNWASIGTTGTVRAISMAAQLDTMIAIVQALNEMEIIEDRETEDSEIVDIISYDKAVRRALTIIQGCAHMRTAEKGDATKLLQAFLEGGR